MKLELSQQAASYLKRLDQPTRKRIDTALQEAIVDPIGGSQPLINRSVERKIRVGGLRILFRITGDGENRTVAIDAILPRGDVYKHTRH